MTRILIASAILASATIASADPPPCNRWQNGLSVCDTLKQPSTCTYSALDEENANRHIYSSVPDLACQSYIKKSFEKPQGYLPSKGIRACQFDPGPNQPCKEVDWGLEFARCVFDGADEDTEIDSDDDIGWLVWYVHPTPEPHCFCTLNANTPHAGLPPPPPWIDFPVDGYEKLRVMTQGNFPTAMKQAILEQNASGLGVFRSDAPFDPYRISGLQKDNIYEGDAAEVDHIIPRADSKGCLCGPNTPDNAALISRDLNSGMSNTSPNNDQNRAQMYAEFVTCPDPSTAEYHGPKDFAAPDYHPETHQLDESVLDVGTKCTTESAGKLEGPAKPAALDEASGGCSTTGGAGLAAIALALGVMLSSAGGRSRARR